MKNHLISLLLVISALSALLEQLQSSFRAVSEQFPSNFRAISVIVTSKTMKKSNVTRPTFAINTRSKLNRIQLNKIAIKITNQWKKKRQSENRFRFGFGFITFRYKKKNINNLNSNSKWLWQKYEINQSGSIRFQFGFKPVLDRFQLFDLHFRYKLVNSK